MTAKLSCSTGRVYKSTLKTSGIQGRTIFGQNYILKAVLKFCWSFSKGHKELAVFDGALPGHEAPKG